ncbi:MAG: ATP-binding protein [Oscillospiraceae bacterium]
MSKQAAREGKALEKAEKQFAAAQAKLRPLQTEKQKKRPKLQKDARVNVKSFSWGFFLFVFVGLLIINSCQIMVYIAMVESGSSWVEMAPSLVGYACLTSLVVCCVIVGVRNVSFNRPVRYLGSAARQLASGNFSVRVAPMRKDGKKDYMEVLIDDFNTMAKELGGIDEMKDDFIGNVSHEIKTPVAVIQNYALALRSPALPEELREDYTLSIIEASKKLSALVTNILLLNKLENQEIIAAAAPYSLAGQLRECAIAFEEQWEAKNIEFTAELEDSAMVAFDPHVLEMVWNSLLSNAVKFSEKNGSIRLSQTTEGGYTFVAITDTGCGMAEETRKHIFEKFYQGDASHSKEGNGLGLALVKRIVDLCGGSLTAESRLGRGTRICVGLPVLA